jgi:MinD superfamily P-loop ATPase
MMVSVWSTKGGTGCSTVALALALNKMKEGKTVSLVDANIYSSTLTAMMGVEGTSYGLDRLFLYQDTDMLQKAANENWVNIQGLYFMPGMKFPPDGLEQVWAKKMAESITGDFIIIDAGSNLLNPFQKELLLRSDFIVVVVTPLIFTYHRLWEQWLHEFFIPHHLVRKTGVLINQYEGPVSPKDIATLMGVTLLGDLPHEKYLLERINLGEITGLFSGKYQKKISKAWEVVKKYAETASTIVPSSLATMRTTQEGRAWSFEP